MALLSKNRNANNNKNNIVFARKLSDSGHIYVTRAVLIPSRFYFNRYWNIRYKLLCKRKDYKAKACPKVRNVFRLGSPVVKPGKFWLIKTPFPALWALETNSWGYFSRGAESLWHMTGRGGGDNYPHMN